MPISTCAQKAMRQCHSLQALYLDKGAKEKLTDEAIRVFGKAIWLDNTRANRLCLRVSDDGKMPSAEDRLEPEKMRRIGSSRTRGTASSRTWAPALRSSSVSARYA